MAADSEMPIYHESQIRTFDAAYIRTFPGMFIGNTDAVGLHYLLNELLWFTPYTPGDVLAGPIGVTFHADGACSVRHLARSISHLERAFTEYEPEAWHRGYVGMATTALSEWCRVETDDDDQHFRIEFTRGVMTTPVQCVGRSSGPTGTTIRFKPDPDIFGNITFDLAAILNRLCALAFLNSGVRLTFTDDRTGKTDQFHFADGLATYVKYLNTGNTALHEPISLRGEEGAIRVEIALQFNTSLESVEVGYVNNEFTRCGGTHLTGLRRGLTIGLKAFGLPLGLFPEALDLKGDDFRIGLTAVVHVHHPNPRWESATRSSVGNTELIGVVSRVVRKGIAESVDANPSAGQRICEQVVQNAKLRLAERE